MPRNKYSQRNQHAESPAPASSASGALAGQYGRRTFLQQLAALGGLASLGFPSARSAAQSSTAAGGAARRPNIVWIMFDDGRADGISCSGTPWARTPHIDAIAARGVRFDAAIIQNPVCAPQRNSIKTSLYPHEAGANELGKAPEIVGRYVDQAAIDRVQAGPTLLDLWTQAGTQPTNIGKIHSFRKSWKSLGDHKPIAPWSRERGGEEEEGKRLIPGERVYTRKYGWLIGGVLDVAPTETDTFKIGEQGVQTINALADAGEPFFLRLSFHSPHVPCAVPKEFLVDPASVGLPQPDETELNDRPKFEQGPIRSYAGADLTPEQIALARATYYGMFSEVDAQIGRVVETLRERGLLENTIIAINSDSGFQLGEHGTWKKRVFYEQNVRVPLVFSWPGVLPEGKVIEEPVELVDFLPTLLDLSGLAAPEGIRGRSLRPLIDGKVQRWRKATISEIDHSLSPYDELRAGTDGKGSGRQVMVRTRDWKLITFFDERVADKDGALFDLRNDPGETRNLYHDPAHAAQVAELEALLAEWDRTKNLLIA